MFLELRDVTRRPSRRQSLALPMFTVSLQLAGVTAKGQTRSVYHRCRRRRRRHHLRRYSSREGEGCPKRRGEPADRRCLASTEIKNIDSHSHAGLHRGSIRFSPARQYPFFPRTVRGTNCSCIPPPPLFSLSPSRRAGSRRNLKHKGSLFHLAATATRSPPWSLNQRASFRAILVFALVPVRPVQMYGDVMLYIID